MDVLSETFASNSSPQNPSRSPVFGPLKLIDYGPSDNDRRNVSVTYLQLQVRGGSHNHFLNAIVGGWSVAPILTIQNGTPYTMVNGVDRDLDGSSLGDRPNIGNPRAPVNTRALTVRQASAGAVCRIQLL